MGVTWVPTEEILTSGERGATEHVCEQVLKWSYKLSEAIAKHINDEETQKATRRSGGRTGQSGFTAEERQLRDDRNWHIQNYEYAKSLYQEIQNEKAARKGYTKGHGKGAKSTKSKGQKGKGKRSFDEMSDNEKWWLEQWWNGNLRSLRDEATAKCRRIEAKAFTIGE